MRTARLTAPGAVEVVAGAVPDVRPGQSLVQVATVGLCGSDLHWFGEGGIGDAVLSRPLVLGHEFSGVVQGGALDGQLVAVDPAVPCNVCQRCREGNHNLCPRIGFAGHGVTDGGLQEYLAWPSELLFPVPKSFSPATAALLEPLGVAVHSVDLGHVRLGATIAVVGCGPIGLMVLKVARAAGASRVVAVEPLAHRRAAAVKWGADVVVAPDDASAAGIDAADVVFEVAGTDEAVAVGMRLARPGARVVLVGIPGHDSTTFPAALARRKGLTIALVRRMKHVYPRAIDLVERGVVNLDELVSHRFSLAEANYAFCQAAGRGGLKTVVDVADF